MRIFVYIIWFGLPALFFSLSLWSKLEQLGKSHKKQNPGDFFRQGVFLLVCALICLVLDRYVLEWFVENIAPEATPLGFYQLIIFPLVMVIGAKFAGGSKPILIENAPRPSHSQPQSQFKKK
jgi:hypothetical protein